MIMGSFVISEMQKVFGLIQLVIMEKITDILRYGDTLLSSKTPQV